MSNVHSFVYWKSQHNMKKLCNKDSEDSSSPFYGLPVQVVLVVFHCVPHLFAALSFNICRNGCGFWNCRTASALSVEQLLHRGAMHYRIRWPLGRFLKPKNVQSKVHINHSPHQKVELKVVMYFKIKHNIYLICSLVRCSMSCEAPL